MTDLDKARKIAAALHEGGIPDFLNRWLAMLPPQQKEEIKHMSITTQNLTIPGVGIVKMGASKDVPAAIASRKANLAAMASVIVPKPAPGAVIIAPGSSMPIPPPNTPAAPAANQTETDVKNTKAKDAPKPAPKATRAPAARAAPKASKPENGAGPADAGAKPKPKQKAETKTQLVDRLLCSKLGATRETLSEKTGWPSVNLRVAAQRRPDHVLISNEGGRYRLVPKAEFDALPKDSEWKKVTL